MINEVRNSIGFANFAAAKKVKVRAPYSAKFQPLQAEVEAVRKADAVEPYSVEQSLRAFDEEPEETNADDLEDLSRAEVGSVPDSTDIKSSGQTQLYSNSGHVPSQEAPENQPIADEQLDDQAIIDTVVTNLSDKIDMSFGTLEASVTNAIEMRLGQALLGVFKQQLADETSARLRQSIAGIVAERSDAKVVISGPNELIELFKTHSQEGDEEANKPSFVVDEASTDLIVQIDEMSITSRFDELDNLVSELFE